MCCTLFTSRGRRTTHAYDTTNTGAGVLMYKPDVLHLVYKQEEGAHACDRDTANTGAGVLMYKPDVLHLVYKQRKAHTHAVVILLTQEPAF